MRHVVIGTAGHVDHGKTALVYALTKVQTDRLPEEQRRGITIELGFAPWRLSDELLVSIIDAPGHRRLVHTMIAGAAGIEIVLLVVAADEGVMPQTREHIAACRLLGVRRAVVAITKLDRVDPELAELAGEEARELLAEQGIEAGVVVCSAKTGEGVDGVRDAVREAIAATPPQKVGSRVRLWVDRVFTVHGSGTVVTGTLVEGQLRVGDGLRVVGPERELSVAARALHVHGEACDEIAAPTRLAINLASGAGRARVGVDEVDRGDLITDDAAIQPTRVVDVWLEREAGVKIRRGTQASIFVGTARSAARIQPIDASPAEAPSPAGALARLRLTAPLVVAGGDRFVLRGAQVDGPAGAVIGGGVVLDARPPRNVRARKRAELLAAAQQRGPSGLVHALVSEASPRPLRRDELAARLSVPAAELAEVADDLVVQGELVAVQGVGWLAHDALAALHARARELVAQHHRAAPLERGLRLQTLREQLAAIAGADATNELLSRLGTAAASAGNADAKLIIEDDVVRLGSFVGVEQDEEASRALAAVRALLEQAGLQGVTEHAAGQTSGVDPKKTRALLAVLARQGAAVSASDLWFDAKAVDELRARVVEHLRRRGKLTIAEFKEMTGLGRRQTIPLLEHFDRTGVTRRQGHDRVLASASKE